MYASGHNLLRMVQQILTIYNLQKKINFKLIHYCSTHSNKASSDN
jgi:hypothetical protein